MLGVLFIRNKQYRNLTERLNLSMILIKIIN